MALFSVFVCEFPAHRFEEKELSKFLSCGKLELLLVVLYSKCVVLEFERNELDARPGRNSAVFRLKFIGF
jgi:hypothetical protein